MSYLYKSANSYFKETFGFKVYKLALDAGMTCPNRDGKLDTRGCIFCSSGGSGDFAQKECSNINLQIEKAKNRLKGKYAGEKFIAYYQSYTNTYASIERLREVFYPAIMHPEIVALSIATRPDCLPHDVLELIRELNNIKPVIIELGLQTIHEESARLIRRGYETHVYDEAVHNLHKIGVHIITHMILGLPYETPEMMIKTAKHIGDVGSQGVKLQLLHVLENTDLEKLYSSKAFETLSKKEYIRILCDCVLSLPENTVLHRITGDAPKASLIAPLWSTDKKRVLQEIRDAFKENDILFV